MQQPLSVDSEIQQDVNQMILAYVGYQTVEAYLALFARLCTGLHDTQDDEDSLADFQKEVKAWTELFSQFMIQFDAAPSMAECMALYIPIIQLLILISAWLHQNLQLQGSTIETPDYTTRWTRDQAINGFFRQLWLSVRNGIVDAELDRRHDQSRRPQGLSLLDHVLPLFLRVASHMLPTGRTVNTGFMQISIGFMTHASLERIESNRLSMSELITNVEQCFAWGFIERNTLELRTAELMCRFQQHTHDRFATDDVEEALQDAAIMEDDVCRMFCETGHACIGENQEHPTSSAEVPGWAEMRQDRLDKMLGLVKRLSKSTPGQRCSEMHKMYEEHDTLRFLNDFTEYLKQHWKMIHHRSWLDLPILVQIENGVLYDLSPQEFEHFVKRVGLDVYVSDGEGK